MSTPESTLVPQNRETRKRVRPLLDPANWPRAPIQLLKLLATILAGVLICSRVRWDAFFALLSGVDGPQFLCAVALAWGGFLCIAMADRAAFRVVGSSFSFASLLATNLKAVFFSAIHDLVGGAFRFAQFSGREGKFGEAAFCLVFERLLMLCVNFVVFLAAYLYGVRYCFQPRDQMVLNTVAVVGCLGLSLFPLLLSPTARRWVSATIRAAARRIRHPLFESALNAIVFAQVRRPGGWRHSAGALLWITAHSFLAVLSFACLLRSLNINLPVPALLFTLSLLFIAQTFPITMYGLGVREGILMYLFTVFGLAREAGVLVGLSSFAIALHIGAVGGLTYGAAKLRGVRTRRRRQ